MRIISGKFKGKKLHHPLDNLTRPLRDMVKEAIFNFLAHSEHIKINMKDDKPKFWQSVPFTMYQRDVHLNKICMEHRKIM